MLHAIDYLVVAVYFVLTLAIGFWSARKAKQSSKGFFVAESSLPWWVVGFTMVAASISAEQMLGEVGYASSAGLAVSNWDLGVFPSLVLMLFVFLPLYLRNNIVTIPEYLERRYNPLTRLLFAAYTVFNNSCITLVMVLALGAKAIKYFTQSETYEGIPELYGAAALALFTGLYTVYGGMSSVAWTDTFQCVLLLAGGLLIFFLGMSHVEGGLEGLVERMSAATPPTHHLIRSVHDPYVPWPGLILLMLSTNVWYCCTNQFYVQATLGAKNEWHGRMGVLLTAFLGPVMTLCFAFPGYIANDLVNQNRLARIEDANALYPMLVHYFLGPGLRGFMVAAVLGAIMSTVSSIVNATASVFTNDIYQRWLRPGAGERVLVRTGRLAGFATLLVAYPLVLFAAKYSFIFTYSQNAWCVLAIPIMIVFTFGAIWRRATSRAANTIFLLIAPFVAVPFLWGNTNDNYLSFGSAQIHLFNFACLLWLAAMLGFVILSLLSAPAPAAVSAAYVWKPQMASLPGEAVGQPSWYRSIWFWTIVAGLIYVLIYYKYW